jgi:poly(A) polymerase
MTLAKPSTKPILKKSDSTLMARLGSIADEANVELYAVGGYVRDRLLGRKVKDIDFTVIGNALDFAAMVATKLQVRNPVNFPRFGTAMVPYRGYHLDFVTARSEVYAEHSRKPVVSTGSLAADLARRDFTINALAVSLNDKRYGEIVD